MVAPAHGAFEPLARTPITPVSAPTRAVDAVPEARALDERHARIDGTLLDLARGAAVSFGAHARRAARTPHTTPAAAAVGLLALGTEPSGFARAFSARDVVAAVEITVVKARLAREAGPVGRTVAHAVGADAVEAATSWAGPHGACCARVSGVALANIGAIQLAMQALGRCGRGRHKEREKQRENGELPVHARKKVGSHYPEQSRKIWKVLLDFFVCF